MPINASVPIPTSPQAIAPSRKIEASETVTFSNGSSMSKLAYIGFAINALTTDPASNPELQSHPDWIKQIQGLHGENDANIRSLDDLSKAVEEFTASNFGEQNQVTITTYQNKKNPENSKIQFTLASEPERFTDSFSLVVTGKTSAPPDPQKPQYRDSNYYSLESICDRFAHLDAATEKAKINTAVSAPSVQAPPFIPGAIPPIQASPASFPTQTAVPGVQAPPAAVPPSSVPRVQAAASASPPVLTSDQVMTALESDRQQRTHQVQSDLNDIDRVVRGFQTGDELNGLKLAEWGAQVSGTLAKVGIVLGEYARSEREKAFVDGVCSKLDFVLKNAPSQVDGFLERLEVLPEEEKQAFKGQPSAEQSPSVETSTQSEADPVNKIAGKLNNITPNDPLPKLELKENATVLEKLEALDKFLDQIIERIDSLDSRLTALEQKVQAMAQENSASSTPPPEEGRSTKAVVRQAHQPGRREEESHLQRVEHLPTRENGSSTTLAQVSEPTNPSSALEPVPLPTELTSGNRPLADLVESGNDVVAEKMLGFASAVAQLRGADLADGVITPNNKTIFGYDEATQSLVCYGAADSTLLFCASKNEKGQWNVLPEDDNLTPAHRKFFVNAPQTVEGIEKLYAHELEQEMGAKLVKHFLSDPESFPPPLSKYQFAVAQTSEGYRFTGMQVADGNRVFEATSSQNDTGQYEVDTKLCKIPEREVEKIILREQQPSFAPQKQLEFGQPEP